MAKLLDDLMARMDADWEPTAPKEAAITISARLPEFHVAMVDSLTMANLSTNRTESLKILIEAGYEFLKDKVPMDLDENVDLGSARLGNRRRTVMLVLEGILINVFETPKGVTKDGKEYGGESKIQVMYENTLANGENARKWRL